MNWGNNDYAPDRDGQWASQAECSRRNSASMDLLATTSLAAAWPAGGGAFNNKNLLTGETAAGLGGAYVALSDDTAGEFYKPAGIGPGMLESQKRKSHLVLGASLLVSDSLNEDQTEDSEDVVIGNDAPYEHTMALDDHQARTDDLGQPLCMTIVATHAQESALQSPPAQ